ncbi:MAG: hypothetical protein AB7Q29_16490 [Vicinamibacterales bacterium]
MTPLTPLTPAPPARVRILRVDSASPGLCVAAIVMPAIRAQLFGVEPSDPLAQVLRGV